MAVAEPTSTPVFRGVEALFRVAVDEKRVSFGENSFEDELCECGLTGELMVLFREGRQ